MAKRVDEHEPSEETKFIILTKKPKSAIDAMVLADKLLANNATYYGDLIRTVPRSALLNTTYLIQLLTGIFTQYLIMNY